GPERYRLKKKVAELALENVVFGESPYDEMDQLYSIAYASIATLRKLNVSKAMRLSKIFPSLSCEVPVIYAGMGEAADLLLQNGCGIVTEPEDAHQLAQAVQKLASDSDLRNGMGAAGRALVQSEFSWEVIVERWMKEVYCTAQA